MKKYHSTRKYFLPHSAPWPIVGCFALFFLAIGIAGLVHNNSAWPYLLLAGAILFILMLYGWFSSVIEENVEGLHSNKMDRSYRWGMFWFITSEVFFFGILFGALFYVRLFAVPTLGGQWGVLETHQLLWPHFQSAWPLLSAPNSAQFPKITQAMATWGIPALNTLILLSSALAVTWAHWGLLKRRRWQLMIGVILTILLGLSFIGLQVHEYLIAYLEYHLTLKSGIYGSLFFMLTGFHGLHVMIGLIMLTVILFRCYKGHFLPEHHFGFEAVSWYWHFVDVVWLFLFVFVYWI